MSRINLNKYTMAKAIWISLLLYIILILFLDSSTYRDSTDTFNNNFDGTTFQVVYLRLYRIVMGIAGSLFFILLFRRIFSKMGDDNKSSLCHLAGKIGQYTLVIYILQSFILEYLMARLLNFDDVDPILFNLIIVPSISLLLLFVCYSIATLISKNRYLSFILLGKRLK